MYLTIRYRVAAIESATHRLNQLGQRSKYGGIHKNETLLLLRQKQWGVCSKPSYRYQCPTGFWCSAVTLPDN